MSYRKFSKWFCGLDETIKFLAIMFFSTFVAWSVFYAIYQLYLFLDESGVFVF